MSLAFQTPPIMNATTEYTYVPIRYSPNPESGEAINVGVLLSAPETGFVKCAMDIHVARLSHAFGGFDVNLHRRFISSFKVGVMYQRARFPSGGANLFERLGDAESVAREIWPDAGPCYVQGPQMQGQAIDLAEALDAHFDRLITQNSPNPEDRDSREDDEIWSDVVPTLRVHRLSHYWVSRTVETSDGPLHFDHVYQGDSLHVLQPVSFDLLERESMLRKAHTWFGRGDTMRRSGKFGTLILVLGRPSNPNLLEEYEQCRSILNRIAMSPEIYEESEIELLVDRLRSLVD